MPERCIYPSIVFIQLNFYLADSANAFRFISARLSIDWRLKYCMGIHLLCETVYMWEGWNIHIHMAMECLEESACLFWKPFKRKKKSNETGSEKLVRWKIGSCNRVRKIKNSIGYCQMDKIVFCRSINVKFMNLYGIKTFLVRDVKF